MDTPSHAPANDGSQPSLKQRWLSCTPEAPTNAPATNGGLATGVHIARDAEAKNLNPSSQDSGVNCASPSSGATSTAPAEEEAPVFWSNSGTATRHNRSFSTVSYHPLSSERPTPIVLEDRSDEAHDAAQGCWAASVTIDDYTIVSGSGPMGAYVVWHCAVRTLKGGELEFRKRYSEFAQLRTDLVKSFPHAEKMIPPLPRKSVVSRFRPWFLKKRKEGLAHFMNCVVLNSEFATSPVVKEFIFS
jgi:hypothetical protein